MEIKLEICCGTTCFMLGSGKLLKYAETLPEEWKKQIDVSGLACMDACTAEDIGHAPFIRLDGKIYGDVSVEKLHALLAEKLDGKEPCDHV